MRIPEYLKIGPLMYKTDYDPRLAGGQRAFGTTVPMELRIVLDAASHEMQQLEAYWHEVVEVLNDEYQLELEHHKITVLGSALTQILVDNAQAICDLLTDLLSGKDEGVEVKE